MKGKVSNIVNGWSNVVFKSPEVEALANKRAKICDTCPYASSGSVFDLEDEKVVELKGFCVKCGCPFKAKLRSINEICDINKW